MSFKKCKVVMLPTNEKAIKPLLVNPSTRKMEQTRHEHNYPAGEYQHVGYKTYHLYIISDDKIEDGDWFILLMDSGLHELHNRKTTNIKHWDNNYAWTKDCKKVIATTDKSLTICSYDSSDELSTPGKMYLPQPSESFIQKYIESYNRGEVITDVLVEYESKNISDNEGFFNLQYILKINPKDNTITIRKQKDSWSKEEVIELLLSLNRDKPGNFDCSKWIEENL